jgi:serine protease AprX
MSNDSKRRRSEVHLTSPVISPALRTALAEAKDATATPVIISLLVSKIAPREGVRASKDEVKGLIDSLVHDKYDPGLKESDFFVFARLSAGDINALAEHKEVIHVIWLDHRCQAHLLSSVDTIKARACWRTFEARGKGVIWAVLDTGIDSDHPHFKQSETVIKDLSISFVDGEDTWEDLNGHGTHVGGIIAGAAPPKADNSNYRAATYLEDPDTPIPQELDGLPSGVAPMAKLIAVKVLDKEAAGQASTAIQGLEYVRHLNESSRDIRVDGVNLSLGYPLEQQSYGCGHSPLCEEVNRVVRSGINVVVSCGNDGYGISNVEIAGETRRVGMGFALSVSDPANAENCIAVGSAHKSAPHRFGVSYFSSKGPTNDGRNKPDLVAPGEKVISCSRNMKDYEYEERSGTSMAAPHVSGAIAAFLSLHPEYRGDPEEVKRIFLASAMDLGRAAAFQGGGLLDLFKAITSV